MPRPNTGPKLRTNNKRGGIYYIHWTERGRSKQQSTGTRDFEDAQDALAEFLARRSRPDGPRDPSQVTIMDALENYALGRGREIKSKERLVYAIAALEPYFGHLSIADISPELCAAYQRFRGVSDGTIRRELGVLRAAINYEYENNRITRTVKVKLPKKPASRDRWLSRKEAANLLRQARKEPRAPHLPLYILFGLYTGARKAAILEMRWPQIDIERGLIYLNPKDREQTNKQRPTIPIHRKLRVFLTQAKMKASDTGYVINRNGKPVKDIKRAFMTACEKAGIADVVPTTLRHTCGTWMVRRGIPLWDVARWLGHSTTKTTELYAHHDPEYLKFAAEVLD